MNKLLTGGLIGVAILSASFLSGVADAAPPGVTGTTWGGNVAKAHSGYRFLQVGSLAQVEKRSTHEIMGAYECVAPKGGDSLGCALHVNPTVVECQGTATNGGRCKLRPRVAQRN